MRIAAVVLPVPAHVLHRLRRKWPPINDMSYLPYLDPRQLAGRLRPQARPTCPTCPPTHVTQEMLFSYSSSSREGRVSRTSAAVTTTYGMVGVGRAAGQVGHDSPARVLAAVAGVTYRDDRRTPAIFAGWVLPTAAVTPVADWTPATGVAVAFLAGLLVGWLVGARWGWSRSLERMPRLLADGAIREAADRAVIRDRAIAQLTPTIPGEASTAVRQDEIRFDRLTPAQERQFARLTAQLKRRGYSA